MNKLSFNLFLLIFTSFLCGCHPLYCNWDNDYTQLANAPERDQLIGIYNLSESSKEYLIDEGFLEVGSQLVLKSDGQFILNKAPDNIFNSTGNSNKKLITKTGKWYVSCDSSYLCMIELEGVCVTPLSDKNGQLAIPITIGDADVCKGIVYEKTK